MSEISIVYPRIVKSRNANTPYLYIEFKLSERLDSIKAFIIIALTYNFKRKEKICLIT